MEKIEVILTDCMREIRSGRSTLHQCLDRYPTRRQDLEPLLKMALNIQSPPSFSLSLVDKQSAKSQLLRQIRTTKPKKTRSIADIFSFGFPRQLVWARIAVAVVIGIIILSMVGGGTAYASQDSLPGEFLYPVKTGTEDIRLWMAGDSLKKADLNLVFSQARLDELSRLADRGSNKVDIALSGYQKNLLAAVNDVRNIIDVSVLSGILESFSLKLQSQISYCERIIDSHPDDESIRATDDVAINQQIEILKSLAEQDNLQAARLNINMMQDRLQRAQVKAGEQQYLSMQQVVLQYQLFNQLGLKILQDAQLTGDQADEIGILSAGALQSYIGTLDTLSKQVPQEYQNALETSQELTLQFQNQTRYQYQGGTDQGPNRSPSLDGSNTGEEQGMPSTAGSQGDIGSNGSTGQVSPGGTPGGTGTGNDNNGPTDPGGSNLGQTLSPSPNTPGDGGSGNGTARGPTPTPGNPSG